MLKFLFNKITELYPKLLQWIYKKKKVSLAESIGSKGGYAIDLTSTALIIGLFLTVAPISRERS